MAAPEGNGCAERFIRTLKEQLLCVEPFETVQQLRLALLAFKDRYNQKWLVERHGHRTPAAVRQALCRAPERLHDYRERSVQETRSGTVHASPELSDTAEPNCDSPIVPQWVLPSTEVESLGAPN